MLVACYGSLKKGHYNHRALGADAKFLGKSTVFGVMYSNGSYPKLYKSVSEFEESKELSERFLADEKAVEHEIEIYDIEPDRFRSIRNMEIGAGYEAEEIKTPYGEATIYWMPHEHFYEGDTWVESYTDGKVSD